ncbi:hypothetical protein EJ07DRAFT_110877 [Lizonia empirigonia]|nr:hypothetical protein EJ07DRAFT_110877 [Lizonia empirigonia]
MKPQLNSLLAQSRCPVRDVAIYKWRRSAFPTRSYATKFDLFGDKPVPANKQRFVPTSGFYPKGFDIGGVHAGIKPASHSQADLVMVVSPGHLCSAAAVFTKNEFPAASISVSRDIIREHKGRGIRGIIANSWCANTLTGAAGLEDSITMSRAAENSLFETRSDTARSPSFLVMHTGLGGQRLPMEPILGNMSRLSNSIGSSHQHWMQAAWGLATTDTFPKLVSRKFTLSRWGPGTSFSLSGITKGAGMVHPNMATTLGVICADVPITPRAVQQLLSVSTEKTYNRISIDGDTSTNDMVTLLANGAATSPPGQQTMNHAQSVDWDPTPGALQSDDFVAMQHCLDDVMAEMAKLVVRDAEGASKFITIRVRGCTDEKAAHRIASTIARSALVKTSIYGEGPTWGNVLAALGYSLVDTEFAGRGLIVPELTSIGFTQPDAPKQLTKFLERGVPVDVDAVQAKDLMAAEDIEMVVDLRDDGSDFQRNVEECVYWTSDLTHDFVTLNSGVSH